MGTMDVEESAESARTVLNVWLERVNAFQTVRVGNVETAVAMTSPTRVGHAERTRVVRLGNASKVRAFLTARARDVVMTVVMASAECVATAKAASRVSARARPSAIAQARNAATMAAATVVVPAQQRHPSARTTSARSALQT